MKLLLLCTYPKKKETIRTKIEDCQKDSKKLHALVTNLTTKPIDTNWLVHTSSNQLVEELPTFFEKKIQSIWYLLKDKPKFSPAESDAPCLIRFATLTERQVCDVIRSLKSKSCELDHIPTTILKKMLPVVIPIITRIVNLSLS